ncbi:MAG: gliding motility-associated C-terminal domain-containing protein [bacterium]|nr:gliding motility-associated C-terminal domain-containing protein [bacterium]
MEYRIFRQIKLTKIAGLLLLLLAFICPALQTQAKNLSAPPPTPLTVNPDTGYVNGYNGAASLLNIYANDSFNNATLVPADVILSYTSPSPKISINASTGIVTVATYLAAGTYTIPYTLTDALDALNFASANLIVVVSAPPIFANHDQVWVNGYNGNLNAITVNTNDSINNGLAPRSAIAFTLLSSPTEPNVIMNTLNGRVSIFPMTPAGVYYFVYRICDTLNPANCDTALVTVNVMAPPIFANSNTLNVNGFNGGNNLLNVWSNDQINGAAVNSTNVITSLVTPSANSAITLNTSTGMISVAPAQVAGNYTLVYSICDSMNTTSCDTAIVYINLTPPPIDAKNDTAYVDGYAATANVINVLSNDLLNNASIAINAVSVKWHVASNHPNITLDTLTGNIQVSPRIAVGTYSLQYRIIDTANMGSSDTATAFVVVRAPNVYANPEYAYVNGYDGNPALVQVLANDSINNIALSIGDVKLSVLAQSTHPGVWLNDTTGFIKVMPMVPAGKYIISYKICDTLNMSNCDSASDTIEVMAPIIEAVQDTFIHNGYDASLNIGNVLSNDSINGMVVMAGGVRLLTLMPSSATGIRLNDTTGIISFAPRIAAGYYSIKYQITDTLNAGNIDSTFAIIKVIAPTIFAENDTAYVVGETGSKGVYQVLQNDRINGDSAKTSNTHVKLVIGSGNPKIKLDTLTGFLKVDSLTRAGLYHITYRIIDTLNATNADTGILAIYVSATPVIASNDSLTVNGYNGNLNLGNVLANDSINGLIVSPSRVVISLVQNFPNGDLVLNTFNGRISVFPGTQAGLYSMTYRICDTLNTGVCDTAMVQVLVTPPPIFAHVDHAFVNGFTGNSNAINVFGNDSVNGLPTNALGVITTLVSAASIPDISFDTATGIISVAPNLAAAEYSLVYRICDTLNQSNCDTAIVFIHIMAPPIVATNDTIYADGYSSLGIIGNVLNNDSLNNDTIGVNAVMVKLYSASSHAGISLDTLTGDIHFLPRIAAGTYTLQYSIIDTVNLFSFDTGYVVVVVDSPNVYANPEYVYVNGYNGDTALVQVLANDSINNFSLAIGDVKLTVLSQSSHPGVWLNDTTGYIVVAPLVPVGLYVINYKICDTLNVYNCDTTSDTIEVRAPFILAVADTFMQNGYDTNFAIGNVLSNDSLNYKPLSMGSVSITLITPASNAAIRLDTATGLISLIPRVSAGYYSIQYQISDTLNPTNVDTNFAVIQVMPPSIIAINDTADVIGEVGSMGVYNVLPNDLINGDSVTSSNILLKLVIGSGQNKIRLDTLTGLLQVDSLTPAGIYHIWYRIIDTLNAGNADTAILTIFVSPTPLFANGDSAKVNGYIGNLNLLNVLANDSILGDVVKPGRVNISIVQNSGTSGVVLNTFNGQISVFPNTPLGIYKMIYRICDTLNPSSCDTAYATIYVHGYPLVAKNDSVMVNGYGGLINALNVIDNDSLNGAPLLNTQVRYKELVSAGSGISLDTLTGFVSVAAKTNAGMYTLFYQVTDTLDMNNTDSAYVVIAVFAVGPIAINDEVATPFGLPIVVTPLSNDLDVDNNINIATMKIISMPINGTAVADTILSTITYTPNANWVGYDTLYYSICDSGMVPVLCDTAYIVVSTQDSLNLVFKMTTDVRCFGDSDGMANIILAGGLEPYNITWNTTPVQTGQSASNLKAGNYVAMVIDFLNDTLLVDVTINSPTLISATAKLTNPTCNGKSNGSIELFVSGGTAPYYYFWNNGSVFNPVNNVQAGNYSVVVTDTNGCKINRNYILTESDPMQLSVVKIVDAVCKTTFDGSITLNLTGGTAPYKYLWSNGASTLNLANRLHGEYTLVVTDTFNCSTSGKYTIYYQKENCEQDVFVPQGFSPDGDGINDAYTIDGIEKFPNNHLRIYNRWGAMVFEEVGYKNTWKGTAETGIGSGTGETLPTGTYFYVLELEPGKPVISGYLYISK